MASDLLKLKNIGPASVRQLREVGIENAAALRKLGAIAAYRRLKHAFPREVSLVMLYAPWKAHCATATGTGCRRA